MLRFLTAGESPGPALVVIVEGLPAEGEAQHRREGDVAAPERGRVHEAQHGEKHERGHGAQHGARERVAGPGRGRGDAVERERPDAERHDDAARQQLVAEVDDGQRDEPGADDEVGRELPHRAEACREPGPDAGGGQHHDPAPGAREHHGRDRPRPGRDRPAVLARLDLDR